MKITTKMKRTYGNGPWAPRHTDNNFGGPGRINARRGKSILRRRLKEKLKTFFKNDE